jgi:hypothetical protein
MAPSFPSMTVLEDPAGALLDLGERHETGVVVGGARPVGGAAGRGHRRAL